MTPKRTHRSPRPHRTHIQELSHAVRHAADYEEAVGIVLRNAVRDLPSRWAGLVLPMPVGDGWQVEMVSEGGEHVLGHRIDPSSELGLALAAADLGELEAVRSGAFPGRDGDAEHLLLGVSFVEGGPGLMGALLAARFPDDGPFADASLERLDALGSLAGNGLRGADDRIDAELDDERSRIARDLHDLAIQELFAVGMELETLSASLRDGASAPPEVRIRASVESSVRGVENAVAQIRQIVQSLRRDRPDASLVERLHHETAMAVTGLGFAPALRLPPDMSALEAQMPEDIQEDVVAVVRECLANAARHAHASAVSVAVSLIREGVDRVVQVNVSDNGRGIDPTVTRRSGLANMKSRARRHHGWVDVLNLEPGTMVSWRATLPPA